MKETDYDVIVVGLGAMGSAAIYHLASAGGRVLGFDRFQPPHEFGSSHGLTRIIREAYFEHPAYVPLVQRAYRLWEALEKTAGKRLFFQTGGVMLGPPDGVLVSGALRSARQHHLAHEILSPVQLRRRFPVFNPGPDIVGVSEKRAGVLLPEQAIRAHLKLAAKHGALLHFNEPVAKWKPHGQGVRVYTKASTYSAKKLLLAAGAWMGPLANQPSLPLSVERQVLYWFEPRDRAADFQPSICPIFIWEYAPARFFYGFPDFGDGVKVAIHHQGEPAVPDGVRREVTEQETASMRAVLRDCLPAAEGRLRASSVCLYTNTTDEHFVLDWHPRHPQVLLASPCSGHGFKFASVIGELAMQLLSQQTPSFDLGLFKMGRFDKVR